MNNSTWTGAYTSNNKLYRDMICDGCNGRGLMVRYANDVADCDHCKGYGYFSVEIKDPNQIIKNLL